MLIPWEKLLAKIRPYYPSAGKRRVPYPLEGILRLHSVQLFYNVSDPAMEDMLYEVEVAGLDRHPAGEGAGRDDDPQLPHRRRWRYPLRWKWGNGDRAARLAMEDDGAGLDVVTVIDAHAGGGAGGAVASIHRGYGPVPAVGKILVIPATGCGGMAQGHHLRLVAPVAQCPHSDGLDSVSVAGAAWGEHQGVLVTVRGGVGIHRDGGVVPVGDGHRVTPSRVCAQRHCVGLLHLGRAPRYR